MSLIPKQIHFTWKSQEDLKNRGFFTFDTNEFISFEDCISSFKRLNSDFKIVFWSDKDIEDFIIKEYPAFLSIYSNLNNISKIDFFRYACLYKFGGLSVDIDCYCVRKLDEFFEKFDFVAGEERSEITNWQFYPPHQQLCTWAMFSIPKHDIFFSLINEVIINCCLHPDRPILEKTSMAVYGHIVRRMVNNITSIILPQDYLSLGANFRYMHGDQTFGPNKMPAYILHGYCGTWKGNETNFLNYK